jgi:RNA-binding protein YlmH
MDKGLILSKYSKTEDKLLISKMLDKIELSKVKNKIEYTNFLDMYQKHLLEKILKQEHIENYVITGGTESAERNIIVFYPEKLKEVVNINYKKILPITCIRINLPKEMHSKYSHRDYLGGLIKLGIKREKIGDIFVFDNGADILILDEISKFVMSNISTLTRFSKSKIENLDLRNIREKEIKKEELKIIVSSMRLDSVISEILKTSRGKAEEIIKEQRVFVNFENVDKLTKQIKENDLITIRGKGRFEISKIEGMTRNSRMKLVVNKYI